MLKRVWVQLIASAVAASLLVLGVTNGATAQPARPQTPSGWFHIYSIGHQTYAISEPKYWQQNVSYLLIGTRRALLFDTGPGIYSIRAEVERLTTLPVIAVPTHLHFDHVGDLPEFSDVRLMEAPGMRSQVRNGHFVETQDQYQLRTPFEYRVHAWLKPGQILDLGGRRVRIVRTPGHTPDSLSIIDQGGKTLFIGDLINRMGTLYAVPGSDVKAAAASIQELRRLGSRDAAIYEAHAEAPITQQEFVQVAAAVSAIASNRSSAFTQICLANTPMRKFMVGVFPILVPVPGGAMQPPLESVTQELNFLGGPCK